MKKVYLLMTLLGLSTFTAQAQDEVRMRFGIKAAPNLAWTRSDTKELQSDGSRLGYSIGLMAEFPLGISGNYAFATGLYLTTIGGKSAYSYTYQTVDSAGLPPRDVTVVNKQDLSLRFVELPLTIKMMTNEIGYLRYYGVLGVNAGVNIRARADVETVTSTNNVQDPMEESDVDVKDQIQAIRAALVIGAGAEYNFSGQTTALFGITYNNSIINALEKDAFAGLDRPKLLADYLELTLGIFF